MKPVQAPLPSEPLHPLASAILITWRRNAAYAQRLVADLGDADMQAQPVRGQVMNHPAWVLSHLALYSSVAAAMLHPLPFPDPLDHPHGQRSEPVADPASYLPRVELVQHYRHTHDEAEAALLAASPPVFAFPNPLERARAQQPTVGDMLVTLMVKHESGHLGQLSAWRRAMGLPRVAL